jgi:hypothetical protein
MNGIGILVFAADCADDADQQISIRVIRVIRG